MALTRHRTGLYAADGTTIDVSIGPNLAFEGLVGVEFGFTVDTQKCFNGRGEAVAWTPGRIIVDDITMSLWQSDFLTWVSEAGGHLGMRRNLYDVVVTYSLMDYPMERIVFQGCRVLNARTSQAAGTSENIVYDITLGVLKMQFNSIGGVFGTILSNAAPFLRGTTGFGI